MVVMSLPVATADGDIIAKKRRCGIAVAENDNSTKPLAPTPQATCGVSKLPSWPGSRERKDAPPALHARKYAEDADCARWLHKATCFIREADLPTACLAKIQGNEVIIMSAVGQG